MGVGGGGGGAGSQESGAGSPLHEVCRQREWGDVGALGREKRVSPRQREAREAGVESLLHHTIVLGRTVQDMQAC